VAHERHISLPAVQDVDQNLLVTEEELGLIKTLSQYPFVVEGSSIALEPHRITFYLQELAAQLHAYYNKNRVLPSVDSTEANEDAGSSSSSDLGTDGTASESGKESTYECVPPALTMARLALLRQVQRVIANGLTLLGISAPEKM
jgi:arginyl-tRNA synthetase